MASSSKRRSLSLRSLLHASKSASLKSNDKDDAQDSCLPSTLCVPSPSDSGLERCSYDEAGHNLDGSVLQQTSTGPPPAVERHEKYGLFELSPEQDTIQDPGQPDIVAVHGLNGDAFKTWTHPNGRLWLRDFLPDQVPGARVFSFGYPSEVAFTTAKGKLLDFARSLLESLKSRRLGERLQCRPLIFVCHSMGGIVVKQALITARLDLDNYGDIQESTRGCLFLATPHRGSESVLWPSILANIANVAFAASSSFSGSFRSDLLNALKNGSVELGLISQQFKHLMANIRVVSFLEQNITAPFGKRIVDDETGTLDVPGETIVPMSGCDHRTICWFPRPNSNGYLLVLAHIKKLAAAGLSRFTPNEEACIRSLSFQAMDTRHFAIEPALKNTCTWLFESAEYMNWERRERVADYNGVLWLKGKPGSGKSTLMKQAIQRTKNALPCSCTLILNYYFNARGSELEKTLLGLFRSLLHQLVLSTRPFPEDLLAKFMEKQTTKALWAWELGELQEYFFAILKRLAQKNVTIFIDALDECDEDDARDVVDLFRTATTEAINSGKRLNLCLSSRHYPTIRFAKCLELWVEEYNHADISRYVAAKFDLLEGDDLHREDSKILKQNIIRKASGVFLWVFIIVRKLTTARQKGASMRKLEALVDEVPGDLHALFEQLFITIRDDIERLETLYLMQWVLFSQRPLLVSELRHALAFSGDEPHTSIDSWTQSSDYLEEGAQFEYLLLNRSKGLVEVLRDSEHDSDSAYRDSDDSLGSALKAIMKVPYQSPPQFSTKKRVQLIHESVRDFLIRRGISGFQILNSSLGTQYVGKSHDMLVKTCIAYIATDEARSYIATDEAGNELSVNTFRGAGIMNHDLPFLKYATSYVVEHALAAEKDGVLQKILPQRPLEVNIQTFKVWCKLANPLHWDPSTQRQLTTFVEAEPKTAFLYLACRFDLFGCVKALVDIGVGIDIDVQGKGPALVAAAEGGHYRIAEYLLQQGANVDSRSADGRSALHHATTHGYCKIARLLLRWNAAIDHMDNQGRTSLYHACTCCQPQSVKLLLESNAKLWFCIDNKPQSNILTAAIMSHNRGIIRAVLKYGPDLDLEDEVNESQQRGTPLHASIYGGDNDTTISLLEKGADIWAGSAKSCTLLEAGKSGLLDWVVVQMFRIDQDMSEKLGKQDAAYGMSIIHWATAFKCEGLITLLLEKGDDFSRQDLHGWTPLHHAVVEGQLRLVHDLVCCGARLDLRNLDDLTPLALAIERKSLAAVVYLETLESLGVADQQTTEVAYNAARPEEMLRQRRRLRQMDVDEISGKSARLLHWTSPFKDAVGASRQTWGALKSIKE